MKIFDRSYRELRKLTPVLKKIELFDGLMRTLSDKQLQDKTLEFKSRLDCGESLESILPEAFAVVRETSFRVLGLRHYPVQLIGGILLFQGRIAEMATGEGKTLVAALPSYLMGLTGNGVHIVTVNDYLAERDFNEIGQIHRFLGLTVGCVLSNMSKHDRKQAYACDITYVTNTELCFDYLRDNMVTDVDDVVQRGLKYAIIDEVDSVLIDEARTPLIISGVSETSIDLYNGCQKFVKTLQRGRCDKLTKTDIIIGKALNESGDFIVDEKDKVVHLTELGVSKAESFFKIDNLSDVNNLDLQHHIQMALKANYLMFKDKNYVVTDDSVQIVDEFTGRVLYGRRYSDGLHQAIEAKESVTIQNESCTYATITFQNFFNQYERKSGMTGTALTEAKEFKQIYNLDVISVPTNKPVSRKDLNDVVYLTKDAKYKAVVQAVIDAHKIGQPVLVGTTSIEVSELLSEMLCSEGLVDHQVLNAKQAEREADIIAQAGRFGAVTIATNMAGRGTDIKVDNDALEVGGLFVIGTEKHESRRIDNQLRGRSGRQGDVGKSQFFLSLEDDVLKLFGDQFLIEQLRKIGAKDNAPISNKCLTRFISNAQKSIEGNRFGIRKNVIAYDDVNGSQRDYVYKLRQYVLCQDDVSDIVYEAIQDSVNELLNKYCKGDDKSVWDVQSFIACFNDLCPMVKNIDISKVESFADMKQAMSAIIDEMLEMKVLELGVDTFRQVEKTAILKALDMRWVSQLNDLSILRENVSMLGYGQKDPLTTYKNNAYDLFIQMRKDIRLNVVRFIMRAHFVKPPIEIIEVANI